MTSSTSTSEQHAATARAFSLAAPLYDAEHAANPVARWTRARSLAAIDAAFGPGDMLLEIGCGTGAEAIHLASRGANIVATDAAPAMVAQLEAKLKAGSPAAHLAGRITPVVLPAAEVERLIADFGRDHFDGAYSSFGPLNCEPDLGPVVEALAQLVKPEGKVVVSLINRFCLWETAWYLAARQPGKAFRRWAGRSEATVRSAWQDERITIYYWTPGQVERAFSPYFKPVRRMALPWLVPPQYLDHLVRRLPRLFRRTARLDRRLAGYRPFYSIGDHFLIEFTRARGQGL
ncbi:MAG TPA: class I SAM-dependent methyltransferase [Chloroflexia bacterium]|nr:class I SAM-dependent methyltransferase [Chloroflexia bacterium]